MNLPTMFRRNSHEPFHALNRLQNDFDSLFRQFSDGDMDLMSSEFLPSCELTEDGTHYSVKFDMPGIKKDAVRIELEGNRLTVFADRQEEKKTADRRSRYSEIKYGSYQRSFTLPTMVDEKQVQAKFENGVLTLEIPKAAGTHVKQISVQ